MIVTIDGPVASGKTSLARAVAQELAWFCLFSGYLYRGLTYGLQQHGYHDKNIQDATEVDIATIMSHLEYRYVNNSITIIFHKNDITALLKTYIIDQLVPLISKLPHVRTHMIVLQRNIISQHYNALVEGRDCGTTVFPDADLKIFLTADTSVRARRWQKDQEKNGVHLTLEQCLQFINDRDFQDTTRVCSPLAIPTNALVIDSSNKDFATTVQYVIGMIHQKL